MNANKKRKNSWAFYILVILITTLILGALNKIVLPNEKWLGKAMNPDNTENILFDIERGDTGRIVAKNLEEAGLIDNHRKMYWHFRKDNLGNEIVAGRFVLNQSMTPLEIAETITDSSTTMALTIPEGWTIEQIDTKLVEMGLIESGEFIHCAETCDKSGYAFLQGTSSLEGYLFPDTFFIDPASFSVENTLHRLLNNFETKVLTTETTAAIDASDRSLDEIIIMASIVEREALWDEDRATIAGILWKRNDNGWPLDADATLLYALEDKTLNAETLEIDSPYNTRKNKGLPPTAISNPGLASIQAALYPKSTEYWFYLTDLETGKAHYAATNEGHNENREKYL